MILGINYYIKRKFRKNKHIGKSSMGWKFLFCLNSFKNPGNWKEELRNKHIIDEYGRDISFVDLIELVEQQQFAKEHETSEYYNPININGYLFLEGEFS